jgi:hypothetical protein
MKKNLILAALVVASVTATTTYAGEIGIGLDLFRWNKTVRGGQPVPVYYVPQQQVAAAAPAPAAAPVATAPTMVAVPAGNGTYTLVQVVPVQQAPVPQAYLIPADQVPLAKEEKHFSFGPRLFGYANK